MKTKNKLISERKKLEHELQKINLKIDCHGEPKRMRIIKKFDITRNGICYNCSEIFKCKWLKEASGVVGMGCSCEEWFGNKIKGDSKDVKTA